MTEVQIALGCVWAAGAAISHGFLAESGDYKGYRILASLFWPVTFGMAVGRSMARDLRDDDEEEE